MNVGIITKHAIENYGSFAQAYGLQRTIEDLGHHAEIIDYVYPNVFHPGHRSIKGKIKHGINHLLKNVLAFRGWRLKHRYDECFKTYYHLSKKYPTKDSVFADPPKYDVYVSGSDQIWRPEFTNGDPTFFLDFAPEGAKRIAFSSSFGCVEIPQKHQAAYKDLLNKYSSIAVREASGVKLVKDLTGRDAELVIDPSMLLTGEQWRNIVRQSEVRGKYVVCYGTKNQDAVHRLAHRYADPRGYQVIHIVGNFFDFFKRSERYIIDAGPREWMGLIDGAEMAFIGGSFHGTVFSTLLHTPYVTVLTGHADHDTRQLNLLKLLGIEPCGVLPQDADGVDFDKIRGMLDFDVLDKKIAREREKAIDYLKKSLLLI